VLCLLAALGYIWWYTDLWEVRQECFVRAAAVLIDQRDKAYQDARFAINKHNELVEVYDRLCIEFNEEEERRQEHWPYTTAKNPRNRYSPTTQVTRRLSLRQTRRLSKCKAEHVWEIKFSRLMESNALGRKTLCAVCAPWGTK